MTAPATPCLHSFEFQAATRLVVGAGALARVGDIARQLGGNRALLVSDPGLVATGFPAKAEELLASAMDSTPTSCTSMFVEPLAWMVAPASSVASPSGPTTSAETLTYQVSTITALFGTSL